MDRTHSTGHHDPVRSWCRSISVVTLSFCLINQSWAQEPVPATTAPTASPLSSTSPVAAPASEVPQISLLDGTAIKLRINRTVSSADASVGQPVDFTVVENVAVNETVVIPKGSAAMGKVTEAQPKRRMGRAGKLEIVLTYVRLADADTIPVRAVKDAKGKNAAVGMTVGIVAAGVLFFPAAPLFLLMKGKDITVPEGAEVIAYVDGDRKLDAAKFIPLKPTEVAATPATAPTSTQKEVATSVPLTAAYSSNVAPETTGLVNIESIPAAASIYVDGTFMASTPATLRLSPGPHSVRMALDSYKEWTQDFRVETGAPSHLTAQLERPN